MTATQCVTHTNAVPMRAGTNLRWCHFNDNSHKSNCLVHCASWTVHSSNSFAAAAVDCSDCALHNLTRVLSSAARRVVVLALYNVLSQHPVHSWKLSTHVVVARRRIDLVLSMPLDNAVTAVLEMFYQGTLEFTRWQHPRQHAASVAVLTQSSRNLIDGCEDRQDATPSLCVSYRTAKARDIAQFRSSHYNLVTLLDNVSW